MERQPKAMLIINPISGTGKKKNLVRQVIDELLPAGYDIDVRYTRARGDATKLAAEAISLGYDAVLAAGGDGTVNETARALCDTGMTMGIIPVGSGNGLARHLGIPVDVRSALKIIADGFVIDGDYGTVNDRPFFCTFGLGLDAAVSHSFAKRSRRGLMSYWNSLMNEVFKYTPETYTISANGKILTEKALVIACCNASQYGNNVYIAPEASITDGLLDITIVHQGSPIDQAIVGVDLVTGYLNKNTMTQTLRAPSAVIYRTKAGPAHIDGEPMDMDDIIEVKCHPKGLRLFVPRDTKPFRPLLTPMGSFWREASLRLRNFFGSKA